MPAVFHDRCRIDDLAAHLFRRYIERFQVSTEGIGRINDAGVGTAFPDLSRDFFNVGTVGNVTGLGNGLFIEVVEFQNFLRILTDGNVAVPHNQADGTVS